MTTAADLVQHLALQPHPEGGWYREVYRSADRVQAAQGGRAAITTIYYLLERGQLSRWHVVRSDEIWHFCAGAPLQLLAYDPQGRVMQTHVVGPVVLESAAAAPVAVIAAGVWQASRSLGDYSLVGCTVGPGFEFADFQFVADLPSHADHFKADALAPLTALL